MGTGAVEPCEMLEMGRMVRFSADSDEFACVHDHLQAARLKTRSRIAPCGLGRREIHGLVRLAQRRIPRRGKARRTGPLAQAIGAFAAHGDTAAGGQDGAGFGKDADELRLAFMRPALAAGAERHRMKGGNAPPPERKGAGLLGRICFHPG